MILNGRVVGQGSAQASDIPYRHGNAQGALHVESPPALPQSDGGRDHGIFRSIAVGASGNRAAKEGGEDRKSTRLSSSHPSISYAVFCLKKKKNKKKRTHNKQQT